ncbi:hypothetical protein ERX46_10350 [Brumimicrobium glaciale]|uniref:WG repeat-containing protein n=1 Tax=Brumimicrobium glaciale TaxID=200475 RepID=A0A4V1WFI7_9FLAO|nr:hypothetical protein [Brumimicrobium glaciale]RYM33336.1 hypothetical protein ERX46_10350 [Brumimicrobium glaciale]
MELRKVNNWLLFLFLGLIVFPSFGITNQQKETHHLLVNVNENWTELENEIQFTSTPNSEQELIQLHLLNVISYLENQSVIHLDKKQKENRLLNISILKKYNQQGVFPINNLTNYRTPIFIDSKNTYCAVGYLMKESGFQKAAQEIAEKQLLSYLKDIEHSQLISWQKKSGLSLFELALIQPTYGPPTLVCAAKTPVQWTPVLTDSLKISQIFKNEIDNSIYCISSSDQLGLKHEIKRYSTVDQTWKSVGNQILGQILDLSFCDKEIYVSVLLPHEEFPHQILKLNNEKWEKVAHFNGNIISIQCFQNKLYVLGDFNKVNSSVTTDLAVINENSIESFYKTGKRTHSFDKMLSSKTSLFLLDRGSIYQYKNDTIKPLNSIKYYNYLRDFTLNALADTLYIASIYIPGYYKYFDKQEKAVTLENMVNGTSYPYNNPKLTQSKIVNGNMVISGAFKSSTLKPQINDNSRLIDCNEELSKHWYGEGLLYHFEDTFYPIQADGAVLDFVHLNDKIYILKNDGRIAFAGVENIEKEIVDLRERGLE